MLISISFFTFLVLCAAAANDSCTNRFFSCGGRHIGYPFWGGDRPPECGVREMELRCSFENRTTIDLPGGESFAVLQIDNYSMRIARLDLLSNGFCAERTSWSISPVQLRYRSGVEKVYLYYSCSSDFDGSARQRFNCSGGGTSGVGYVVNETSRAPAGCGWNVTIPVMKSATEEFWRNETVRLEEVLNEGFEVEYVADGGGTCAACESSGGRCRPANNSGATFVCSPTTGNKFHLERKVGIGIGAAALSALIMSAIFFVYHRCYIKRYATPSMRSKSSTTSSWPLTSDLENSGVHIFDYRELQEATCCFDSKLELGDGGFGAVYKGKLRDGRTVAIKRFYENHYRRVEQFLNEIEILSCLRHQNLVNLYGCTSIKNRDLLLVYEYIPNGTVADNLHGSRAKPGLLPWSTRLKIAVETASALSYLHASGVIHRDVKTTNILLDNNFTVKVADFGLSRVQPADVTHVTTAPQGTPGYVDPEYHECYQLTEKSDVYSFGVVLIELISSLPAMDITRDRREINLSTMAINKIQTRKLNELVDPHIGFELDRAVHTMVIGVAELAFRCLQNERDMRPNMHDVLNVLQELQGKNYGTATDDAIEVDVPVDDLAELKSGSQPVSPRRD